MSYEKMYLDTMSTSKKAIALYGKKLSPLVSDFS